MCLVAVFQGPLQNHLGIFVTKSCSCSEACSVRPRVCSLSLPSQFQAPLCGNILLFTKNTLQSVSPLRTALW